MGSGVSMKSKVTQFYPTPTAVSESLCDRLYKKPTGGGAAISMIQSIPEPGLRLRFRLSVVVAVAVAVAVEINEFDCNEEFFFNVAVMFGIRNVTAIDRKRPHP